MRFLSLCSGIEAASVAWKSLGWEPLGFAEIEPFPSAVLAHHYPNTKNYGDIIKYKEWGIETGTVDLVCGGPPCQAFSIAGQRAGMADPRGNLTLTYLALVDHLKPRWIVYENVPGLLSSNGGADFARFIEGLALCGYHCAWRVYDPAQSFGRHRLPQRRRRVFLVGYLGAWEPPASVLFKPQGCGWDSAEGNTQGQDATSSPFKSVGNEGSGIGLTKPIPFRKSRRAQSVDDWETWVSDGYANTLNLFDCGDTRTTHAVVEPQLFENHGQDSRVKGPLEIAPTVAAKYGTGGGNVPLVNEPITFQPGNLMRKAGADPTTTSVRSLGANMGDQRPHICFNYVVRRLTVNECLRLQGFPDNYTAIPWRGKPADQCPDGPQYKAIGNSWAVTVARHIGEQIQLWESNHKTQ